MATKTISIDLEAYELLARRKRAGQSFSDVIKEHLGARRTAGELLASLPSLAGGLTEATLERLEEERSRRRESRYRPPKL